MKCKDVRYHQEENANKDWRWTRYDNSGDVVGKSTEGYRNKDDCVANAEREQATDDTFKVYQDADDENKYRWNVKAKNSKIVGASHKGFLTQPGVEFNAKQNGYENKFKRL